MRPVLSVLLLALQVLLGGARLDLAFEGGRDCCLENACCAEDESASCCGTESEPEAKFVATCGCGLHGELVVPLGGPPATMMPPGSPVPASPCLGAPRPPAETISSDAPKPETQPPEGAR